MHRVPFVSQRAYAFPSATCGVASTMMLLRFHFRRRRIPSYRDLRIDLGVVLPPNSRRLPSDSGVGPDAVTRYFRQHGVAYRAIHRKNRTTWALFRRRLHRAPAMVGMGSRPRRWSEGGHWIVVIDVSADAVTFLDPGRFPAQPRPLTMCLDRFRREWDGTSIQIVGFK